MRFNIVFADIDEWYIDNLSKFTRSSFTSRFNVNVFTQKNTLTDYLSGDSSKTDMLIISPEMLPEDIENYYTGFVAILSDGGMGEDYMGYPCINKYQPGEKILKSILGLFSGENASVEALVRGNRKTRIISVFSPQGGSGKTSIAINLSSLLSRMGLKILYLNLESVNSTPFFAGSSNNEQGLSNVLYYMKDSKENLSIKLELAKSFDEPLGINYFKPVDCSLELDDISEEDTLGMLHHLKEPGQYDIIMVDLDSVLNKRNISVLEASDNILYVVTQDFMAEFKLSAFEQEVRKITFNCEEQFYSKVIPLTNKYIPNNIISDIYVNGKAISTKIPYLSDLYTVEGSISRFNPNNSMGVYLKDLARILAQNQETAEVMGRYAVR